jgi:hypothetical protein
MARGRHYMRHYWQPGNSRRSIYDIIGCYCRNRFHKTSITLRKGNSRRSKKCIRSNSNRTYTWRGICCSNCHHSESNPLHTSSKSSCHKICSLGGRLHIGLCLSNSPQRSNYRPCLSSRHSIQCCMECRCLLSSLA